MGNINFDKVAEEEDLYNSEEDEGSDFIDDDFNKRIYILLFWAFL